MQTSIGPYDVIAEIGRGAMGRVFKVRHRTSQAIRAMKVIGDADGAKTATRFKREAELLARVGGDAVATIHETGTQGETLWYVMDFYEGGSLAGLLAARSKLPWHEAASIVAKVARAIARCHDAGVIHRDVKPENVLLDERGEPRLSDFGCARDLLGDRLTKTGATVGTALYMPLEQLRGARADARADVYGLGVLLYELVTGSVPYDAQSWMDLAARVEGGQWERTHALDPRNPALLDVLIGRALSRNAADRGTALALANELDDLVARFAPAPGATPAPPRAGPRWLVPALVAALVVVGVALVLVATRARPSSLPGTLAVVTTDSSTGTSAPSPPPKDGRRGPLGWRFTVGSVGTFSISNRRSMRGPNLKVDHDHEYLIGWRVARAEPREVELTAAIEWLSVDNGSDGVDFDSSRPSDASSGFHGALGVPFSLVLDPTTGAVTTTTAGAVGRALFAAAPGARDRMRTTLVELSTDRLAHDMFEALLHLLPDGGEIPGWAWELRRPGTQSPFTGRMRPSLDATVEVRELPGEVELAWKGAATSSEYRRNVEGTARFGAEGLRRCRQHEEILLLNDSRTVTDLELVDSSR